MLWPHKLCDRNYCRTDTQGKGDLLLWLWREGERAGKEEIRPYLQGLPG